MTELLSFLGVFIFVILFAGALWWLGNRMCTKLDAKWAEEDAQKFPLLNDKDRPQVDRSVEKFDW